VLRVLLALVVAGVLTRAQPPGPGPSPALNLSELERPRVLEAADRYLGEAPRTITTTPATRSAGGLHDYFSDGDYWWPDPANPDGPYLQRDGMTNPANFVEHRRALMRFGVQMPALTSAWLLTRDRRYAEHAGRHVRAWFVDDATRMNPHLQYAQAIHGRTTGRGTGIIDTIHLVEVVRAIEELEPSGVLTPRDRQRVREWFRAYLTWLTTSPHGIEEREAKNNHGTCWVMQVASFARFVGDETLLASMRDRFKQVLVPGQIAPDGSFPLELRRTKPYGYSLFNLDAFATAAWLLSTKDDDLWAYETADGRGVVKAIDYMIPYIRDRKSWPLPPDVMYDDQWPMRHPVLFLAAMSGVDGKDLLDLWTTLPADSDVEEVVRNFFVRQPLLWVWPPAQRVTRP
jgi:hypothetical protein